MKTPMKVVAEIYRRNKNPHYNFRILTETSKGKKILVYTNQGYANVKDAKEIAGGFTYRGTKASVVVLKKYYRVYIAENNNKK